MREDLANLLKHGSRVRSRLRRPKGQKRELQRSALDELPTRTSISRTWGQQAREKDLRLSVLRRWLTAQVGRLWNDIYSELTSDNRVGSAYLKYQLKEWLSLMVELEVVIIDGEPYCSSHRYRISGWGRADLWVHPETGVLMATQEPRRRYKGPTRTYEQVEIDETSRYARIDGIWYQVTLTEIPFSPEEENAPKEVRPFDLAFHESVPRRYASDRYPSSSFWRYREAWGGMLYVSAKRQLNSREIKRIVAEQAAA